MENNSVTDFDKIMKLIAVLMEQQDWSKANAYCEKLLESDPENPELYLIRCMISHQVRHEADLWKCAQDFSLDKNFQTALKFASPERRKELERIQENHGELSLRKMYGRRPRFHGGGIVFPPEPSE